MPSNCKTAPWAPACGAICLKRAQTRTGLSTAYNLPSRIAARRTLWRIARHPRAPFRATGPICDLHEFSAVQQCGGYQNQYIYGKVAQSQYCERVQRRAASIALENRAKQMKGDGLTRAGRAGCHRDQQISQVKRQKNKRAFEKQRNAAAEPERAR